MNDKFDYMVLGYIIGIFTAFLVLSFAGAI
jgi:uncharacterized membrane protein